MKSTLPALALCCLAAATSSHAAERFKVAVEDAGVYRVAHADLVAAGLAEEAVPSDRIGVRSRGRAVPAWVVDGGDGMFGPSDHVEFVAEHLPGDVSYYHDYARHNVYWIDLASDAPARPEVATADGPCSAPTLLAHRHVERDAVRARFPGNANVPQEAWYWVRLTYLDEPWTLNLDLPDLDSDAGRPIELRIGVRGWSSLPRKLRDLPDHRVEVSVNGVQVAEDEWENAPEGRVISAKLPPALVGATGNQVAVRVPRRDAEDGTGLVDMILVNWLELSYPRSSSRFSAQDLVAWDGSPRCVELPTPDDAELTAWGSDGRWRVVERDGSLHVPATGEGAWVVPRGDLRRPAGIVADRPSDLRTPDRRADYIVVSHRRLIDAVRPLAAFHRERGLAVEVVDVEDVYDEFGDGLETPHAIREFLRYAHESWRAPAPRFVLLVGDASWDTKNAEVDDANYADWTFRHGFRRGEANEFRKNESTPYSRNAELNHRNLIPTWQEITTQGHTASDNPFVVFDDGDRPAMAIGRFPVTEPEEVEGIVAKSIAYATRAPVGPWKTQALFITNESKRYQDRSDEFAAQISESGWSSTKVYPASEEASNELHTRHLIEAMDAGQHIVHFLGHGGRYIWRTGPPDFRKNHDLFTLDDLEQLDANDKASIVLSLSCYSAPFDHPNADSIGEKFLRLADRGAVAVIAASWRNVPSAVYSQTLLRNLAEAGTIGEAFLASKQAIETWVFRDQYNLLGDPALPIQRPALDLRLERDPGAPQSVIVEVPRPDFSGRVRVEWIGPLGQAVETREMAVTDSRFTVPSPADAGAEPPAWLRVYAWDEETGVDGLGTLDVRPPAATEADSVAAGDTDPKRAPSPGTHGGGTPR